jgi:hypothetical protein
MGKPMLGVVGLMALFLLLSLFTGLLVHLIQLGLAIAASVLLIRGLLKKR